MTDIPTDYDFEDEAAPNLRKATKSDSAEERKPIQKASYESSADVQRWLKEQALEDGGTKPAFAPTFIASLRDGPWLLSSLAQFYEESLITDVLHVVKSGKEATVYCCAANPSTQVDYLAAKVYRPRMFRSLRNDVIYRDNRVKHDDEGHIVRDKRHQRGARKKSAWSRAEQVTSWIDYEFQTQRLLYNAGADVPRPFAQIGNAVLMEYIGAVSEPASVLREVTLEQQEAKLLFESILRNVELWLAHDRIHGDLSEYNVLYWQGAITVIDFAQAVDPHLNPNVFSLLVRDIERIVRYFARYGVAADASELAVEMWERWQGRL